MLVILVFFGFSSKPLLSRNPSTLSLTNFSISGLFPVTIMSSAYLMMWIPALILFFKGQLSLTTSSKPFKATLHKVGDIIPPCGVPSTVSSNTPLFITPDFSHCFNTFLSARGVSFIRKSWLILSKHLEISASNTHLGAVFLSRWLLAYATASCVDLCFRNPNEFLSDLTSTAGSSAIWYTACTARSIIVGIPNFRRSVDPAFGISTLRSGWASYLCGFL
jgi:hypothetical protein